MPATSRTRCDVHRTSGGDRLTPVVSAAGVATR